MRQRLQRAQVAGAEVERVDLELARADARPARLSARLASAVVVPLPGMPKSSRLPSSRSQPTGYCVCRRGSSASATSARSRRRRRRSARRGRSCAGSGSGHGRRGGAMPSAALASMIASTSRARSDGCVARRLGLGGLAGARAPARRTRTATTSTAASLVASVTHVISAVWIGMTSSGPSRTYARPGPVAADLGGGALADHVDRSRRRPARAARSAGWCWPGCVVDHAGGPLGGEDQVHAERAAALGDVDQRRQQLGQLARPAWRTRRSRRPGGAAARGGSRSRYSRGCRRPAARSSRSR